jgi:hypothetical protein
MILPGRFAVLLGTSVWSGKLIVPAASSLTDAMKEIAAL